MPEPPDFDQIAREVFTPLFDGPVLYDAMITKEFTGELWLRVAEQLRLVWNARGTADLTALEPIVEKLGDTMDPDNARVFVGDVLRMVDR